MSFNFVQNWICCVHDLKITEKTTTVAATWNKIIDSHVKLVVVFSFLTWKKLQFFFFFKYTPLENKHKINFENILYYYHWQWLHWDQKYIHNNYAWGQKRILIWFFFLFHPFIQRFFKYNVRKKIDLNEEKNHRKLIIQIIIIIIILVHSLISNKNHRHRIQKFDIIINININIVINIKQ